MVLVVYRVIYSVIVSRNSCGCCGNSLMNVSVVISLKIVLVMW